jgi:DNA mismatch repair protein MutS
VAKEKESTGIKNMRAGFNKIFGYYLEIPRTTAGGAVPLHYIRQQAVSNAERYVTEELKLTEEKILSAEEKSLLLEKQLYDLLLETLRKYVPDIQKAAKAAAVLDGVLSLSILAVKNNYVRPVINKSVKHIKIKDGRHPVIEQILQGGFVANDTYLDGGANRAVILTGPNMAGKSTYMRQVALITLLAHMGSFVPAAEAEICLCDQIFTRIGASDDLLYNQSTFMVEMTETANILHNATGRSLIILDELGRGTSTYDGLSVAWAVLEYLSQTVKAKILFATHYHELTELEHTQAGVKNFHSTVKETEDSIVFLHKIKPGAENKSFGVEVAGLAGLPKSVIDRAKEIMKEKYERKSKEY